MKFNITPDEILWMHKAYGKLNFIKGDPSIIKGTLEFDMIYSANKYTLNPTVADPNRIKDSYKIEIILENIPPSKLPQVKEIGGRLEKVKEKYGKESLAAMHVNSNEILCLCSYLEEESKMPNRFNLIDFFNNILVPFFYSQSFYEKKEIWPWGERSHGSLGLCESYLDYREDGNNIKLINDCLRGIKQQQDSAVFFEALVKKDKIKGHWLCFCKSQKRFRDCHGSAFKGLWNLKEDMKRNDHKRQR